MILPIAFLIFGVLCGRLWFSQEVLSHVDIWIMATLSVVVLMAGINIGSKKIILNRLAQYHAKILLLPLATVLGSLLGGAILSFALKIPLNEAAAISAGFAYYSLSAGILAELGGAGLGALAFVSNIFRELLAFLLIPMLAKLNPFLAIAPGGATTMDTTLGIISHCTNEEITVMAMINGIILSALVPILVPVLFGM